MLISSYPERVDRSTVKRKKGLVFLRDETWSTAPILAQVLNLSRSGVYKTLNQFEREGWIKRAYIEEQKMHIWGITSQGLLYAWEDNEKMQSRSFFEPSKLKLLSINHKLFLQQAKLNAKSAGWENWLNGEYLPKGLRKRPDAVVTSPNGSNVLLELEATVKTKKRYESIFSIYLQQIRKGECSAVHYVCPTNDFAQRLKRLFATISHVPVGSERVAIDDRHRSKFPVYSLESWPPHI